MRSLIKNCKGQAVIESVLSLALAIKLFSIFLVALYFIWQKHILDHIYYEKLVCLQSLNTRACQYEFIKDYKKWIHFGQARTVSKRQQHRQIELEYTWHWKWLSYQGKIYVYQPK